MSLPERTIELIVIPYEEETLADRKGRMVKEIFARGAFDGIERRAEPDQGQPRPLDTQTRRRQRAVAFHPSRDEGLVAEVRISNTALGDETLDAGRRRRPGRVGRVPADAGRREMADPRRRVRDPARAGWATSRWCPSPPTRAPEVLAVRSKPAPGTPLDARTSIRCATCWPQERFEELVRQI